MKSRDSLFYIGRSYREIPRSTSNYSNYLDNNYVALWGAETELVNFSVIKLKMEDDFISYKYIYGITHEKKISLAKYGMCISLVTRIELNKQLNNIYFDDYNNLQGNKV